MGLQLTGLHPRLVKIWPLRDDEFASTPSASLSPTPQQIADLLAASHMSGAKRRAFQAEMALKYGEGNGRRAEDIFGWSATPLK